MVSSSGLLMQSCMEKAKEKIVKTTLLSAVEVEVIKNVLKHMISDEDLPEDIVLAIPMYIDRTLTEYSNPEAKVSFDKGFKNFQQECHRTYGEAFSDCSPMQQLEYLKKLESDFVTSETPTFYGTLKQLIFEAFFQTEFGVTNYLAYNPLPGGYEGCVPMGDIARIQHSNDAFKL